MAYGCVLSTGSKLEVKGVFEMNSFGIFMDYDKAKVQQLDFFM